MNFSNKSLILLAVGVLALSIFGTSLSLDLLDGLSSTGHATNALGAVNLTVNSSVSIKMNDSVIDFGTCTISGGVMTFDSNNTAASENNTNCDGTFPDYMVVENDGNTNANVTVEVDKLPTAEYANAAGATMEFKTADHPTNGGCTTPYSWTLFNDLTPKNACGTLTTAAGADQFVIYVRMTMPDTATNTGADDSIAMTFTASAS